MNDVACQAESRGRKAEARSQTFDKLRLNKGQISPRLNTPCNTVINGDILYSPCQESENENPGVVKSVALTPL